MNEKTISGSYVAEATEKFASLTIASEAVLAAPAGKCLTLTVDGVNLHERKVAFVILRRTHFAFNGVARVQIKAADLGGRNVDVVRGGEIARIGTSQKTEAVGKDFKGTVAENLFAGFGAFFENRKHEFLFAHALGIVDLKLHRHVKQLADVQSFEL